MVRIAIAGVVAGLVAAALAAPAGAFVGCHSGRTVFKHRRIRVFSIGRVGGRRSERGSHYRQYYVCGRGARTPVMFDSGQPFNIESVSDFKVFGHRLGFVIGDQGIQSGASVSVGWVRMPRGPVKTGAIWATEGLPEEQELEEHVPKVPAEQLEYAIARDGTVAVASEAHASAAGRPLEWEVCDLRVKRHGLSRPRPLFKTSSPFEAPVLRTIAITGSIVSWRNIAGATISVARR
ncbi:MAG TPA: hypothetical protein VMI13_00270 [Solirubrobacteraceae bacterium]|nr:hypothetical protein [Solirubrobacteraceae bacterium]